VTVECLGATAGVSTEKVYRHEVLYKQITTGREENPDTKYKRKTQTLSVLKT